MALIEETIAEERISRRRQPETSRDHHTEVIGRVALAMLCEVDLARSVTQDVVAVPGAPRAGGDSSPLIGSIRAVVDACVRLLAAQSALDTGKEPAPSMSPQLRALTRLDPISRVVVILHEVEGLDRADIADAVGLSEVAVATRLFRGRQALRAEHEASRAATTSSG